MKKNKTKKIIVILGPTASGKTSLGVDLALKYRGEIISADSRQVYKWMDIGTGKDLDEYTIKKKNKTIKIKHHLIDVVSPNTKFHLAKFTRLTVKAIEDICSRGKVPIIVGGSGLYLQAIVDGYNLPSAKSDLKKRSKLEEKTVLFLQKKLAKLNSNFYKKLNNSDKNNKRRLARYIEIFLQSKTETFSKKKNIGYEFLIMGVTRSREVLLDRIKKRLVDRLENEGMVEEVEMLHKKRRVSWKRLKEFGLEYKYITEFLRGEKGYDEMVERLNIAIRQFAKKQTSWFRRWEKQGAEIKWVKTPKEAQRLTKKFLK